jgi:hypothetical protein
MIAPDTAPKTAPPARSCACASKQINDPPITAKTANFFIPDPCAFPQGQWISKMRPYKGDTEATGGPSVARRSAEKPVSTPGSSPGASSFRIVL